MPVSDDSSSAFDLICAEIERQLRGGELLMDAAAASELLLTVRYQLDTQPRPLVIVHGPLFQAVKAARAQVYGRLIQLRHARCEVLDERWQLRPTGQRDVRALLIDVLNVLLAAITAAGVERAYACAERRAMAAARCRQELPGRVGRRAAVQFRMPSRRRGDPRAGAPHRGYRGCRLPPAG